MNAKILIVDDEPNIVLSLEFLMRREGYAVRAAADGETALEMIAADAPDVILLDIMIPKRSGFDVCQTIRADPALQNVKLVLLTARGREVDREKGLALGADEYVMKPFAIQDLVATVQRLVGHQDVA